MACLAMVFVAAGARPGETQCVEHSSYIGAHVGCAAGDKFMVAFLGHQATKVQVYDAASGN